MPITNVYLSAGMNVVKSEMISALNSPVAMNSDMMSALSSPGPMSSPGSLPHFTPRRGSPKGGNMTLPDTVNPASRVSFSKLSISRPMIFSKSGVNISDICTIN